MRLAMGFQVKKKLSENMDAFASYSSFRGLNPTPKGAGGGGRLGCYGTWGGDILGESLPIGSGGGLGKKKTGKKDPVLKI